MTLPQPTFEFSPDADTAGFRLHQLTVYNWGTFHGKPYSLSPEGLTAILTGDNGTGKSTLADALLTLLVPNKKRNYNQAGQTQKRSERDERDYVMGAYSEKHDAADGIGKKQFLRKGTGHYTVLLATFHNTTLNSWVTLAQVLWIKSTGGVDKVYIAEPRRLTIENEFNHFESSAAIRRIIKDRGIAYHDTFTAYSEKFHGLLCMPKDKTPMEIFNQAICIKDISDLTGFIREFMLDDGGVAEKLDVLRKNFADLRDTNHHIAIATRQLADLNLIKADHDILTILSEERKELLNREEILKPYFAEKELALREKEALRLSSDKLVKEAEHAKVSEAKEGLRARISNIEAELSGSKEGLRLSVIEKLLQQKTTDRDEKKERKARFDDAVVKWKSNVVIADVATFNELRLECQRDKPVLEQRHREIETIELPDHQNRKKEKEEHRTRLEIEKSSLLKRDSNIATSALKIRSRILEALKLTPDDLPFIGELIQVRKDETAWVGAIERLMHDFALGFVVRQELRGKIDAFIHANNLAGHIVYHVLPETIEGLDLIPPVNTVAGKIEIKPEIGHIGTWLAAQLALRFDHVCCKDTLGDFTHHPKALTSSGLIKDNDTTRHKNDIHAINDATHYVLGWDNREKIVAVGNELLALESDLERLEKEIEKLKNERTLINKRLVAAEALLLHYHSFSEIDWSSVAKEIETLEREQKEIQNSSNTLKQLKENKEAAKKELAEAKTRAEGLSKDVILLGGAIETNNKHVDNIHDLLAAFEAASANNPQFINFRARYSGIDALLSFPLTDLAKLEKARSEVINDIRKKLAEKNEKYRDTADLIKRKMESFVNSPDNIQYKDQLAGEYQVPGYNPELYTPFEAVRKKIEEDDLPKTRERFEKLLHSTVYEDVHSFNNTMDLHAKKITGKIDELNKHLRQIDYDRNDKTYIQLVHDKNSNSEIREFHGFRRQALEGSVNETNDIAILKERYERIEVFLKLLEKDPNRTNRVIDVRNWFTFRADEYYRADNALKQSYSGASGKSGGEKNRLASTILATSIAYQYGISINDRQTETFRLVAVDEMFSKTDDNFSEYLLDLFKEFHLQLLIIQPLDAKIHLVQKYVERYHVVTKRGAHSSVRNISVQEYNSIRGEDE
ncbi:MAG: hypothetical protein LBV12_00370 [Puniceicoccales bacterium]|jgi:uncharacterized protein YPO0396|nr:hypothetical protein [Puniceicoccales bacterium]